MSHPAPLAPPSPRLPTYGTARPERPEVSAWPARRVLRTALDVLVFALVVAFFVGVEIWLRVRWWRARRRERA